MAKLPDLIDVDECPYCGHDEFYCYQTVKGKIAVREKFDLESKEDATNTEMWDGIGFGKKFKTAYCGNCHEKVAIDNRED